MITLDWSTKRLMDLALAGVALLVLAPVIVLAALIVWITAGRPIIFRQRRVGLNEKEFTLYKLRTMSQELDHHGNPLPDEMRLTRFGKWLRRWSVDEVPQLWNVLKGDMSLVGPRPLPPEYLDRYSHEQRRRHNVKPGITGWAQVMGRNALDWDLKFRYDVWYVDHVSLSTDTLILLRTIFAVVTGTGIGHGEACSMPAFLGAPGAPPEDDRIPHDTLRRRRQHTAGSHARTRSSRTGSRPWQKNHFGAPAPKTSHGNNKGEIR